MGRLTEELRERAAAQGVGVTHGYRMGHDGHRVNEDSVTTLWPVPGDPRRSLTFEESDGALWCMDEMSPQQALGAALGGRDRDDG